MGFVASVDGPEPEFVEAMERAAFLAHKYQIPLLGFAMGPLIPVRFKMGYRMIVNAADVFALVYGLIAAVAEGRAAVEGAKDSLAQGDEIEKPNGVIEQSNGHIDANGKAL